MKTVKQILENLDLKEYASKEFQKMEILSEEGLFEESRLPILNNALNKDPDDWTDAEKRIVSESLKQVTNSLIGEDINSYMKKNVERNIPVVIVLRRKAIRAFPDNQKIALYYSQALDKHVSIPFGPNNDALGIHLDEQTVPDPLPMNQTQDGSTNIPDAIKVRLARIRKLRKKKSSDGVFIDTPVDDVDSDKPKVPVVPFQARKVPSKIPSYAERIVKNTEGPITNAQLAKMDRNSAKQVYKNELAQHTSELGLLDRLAIRAGSRLGQEFQRGVRAIGNIGKTPMKRVGIKKIKMIPKRPIAEEGIIDTIGKTVATGAGKVIGGAGKVIDKIGNAYSEPIQRILKYNPQGPALSAMKNHFAVKAATSAWKNRQRIGQVVGGITGIAALSSLTGDERKVTAGPERAFSQEGRRDLTGISKSDTDPAAQKGIQVSRAPVDAALAKRVWGSGQTTSTRYAMGESVNNIKSLKTIVETSTPMNISFGDNSISINKNIAEKIINLYESVNNKNKKKIERMLNEDYNSFKEVLNFSIRQ